MTETVIHYLAIYLVFSPLIGAALVGFFTNKLGVKLANLITCLGAFIAFIGGYTVFYNIQNTGTIIDINLMPWFEYSSLACNWSIYIDQLTAFMLLAVTGVSFLVHVYSIGYMSHDPHRQRFMCYLSLFTFCMLMLVCSNNFIQLFFGWEGVGLCSYLLIGFWYKKSSASAAAIKAFIVNRVGDIGLALGIFLIFHKLGSVTYSEIFASITTLVGNKTIILGGEFDTITLICCLIFIGCMGKSAQLGLHTWLPDAMEGPTPVSALIHAATMVTAGIFLVARCSPIFEYSEFALGLVTLIGALTCIFAATIAIVQNDIKKIVAYSTCSQLGYMFFACGVSAYSAGIFHLVTHAAFKALLFLGAGSVIHALSDEQDIRKMGGIWKKIPITYGLFWIGSLAIAGIYPFAGYFSKDAIIELAYASDAKFASFAYLVGVVVAFLTAFYSWRLLLKVFHGPCNVSKSVLNKIHESGFVMILPLILLALGSVFAGYYLEHFIDIVDSSSKGWGSSLFVLSKHNFLHEAHHNIPDLIKYSPTIAGISGIFMAYLVYSIFPSLACTFAKTFRFFKTIFEQKYYFDYLYDGLIVGFIKGSSLICWKGIDQKLIDGIPNSAYKYVKNTGKKLNEIQTGYFYHYALVMILSLIIFLIWSLII